METFDAGRLADPSLECDLIMKGGITSGVVFPKAITRLAERYRFVNIGGTSAGSIAAVMAAAAEYRRSLGGSEEDRAAGFKVIEEMADDLARNLKTLFQPSAATRPLFVLAMSVIASNGKAGAFFAGALRAYPAEVALAALPGLALLAWAACGAFLWAGLAGLLLLVAVPAVTVALKLWRAITVVLPAHDYGICSGLSAAPQGVPAFTDWIAAKLDAASERDPADGSGYRPLTVSDIRERGITVASVTTDLSSGRPYQLPLGTRIFSFRKAEFERLFPQRIVDYLVRTGGRAKTQDDQPLTDENGNGDYYRLPAEGEFPVLLVARLSLSFPGLISAVPLYRFDNTVKDAAGKRGVLVRCLFSDGGITSNFPIHFFDALLPGRPTFGIALGSLDERVPDAPRVFLPTGIRQGSATAAHAIVGLLDFANAILTTARNWQDTLQSRLHGYRERIVEIRLDDDKEGGLNLAMDEKTIDGLIALGDEAAGRLLDANDGFDFDEHRWRRAVTALPALAEALERFSRVWGAPYRTLLLEHDPSGLTGVTRAGRQDLVAFADALAALGGQTRDKPLPKPSAQRAIVRVVARVDTDESPAGG
ncbi:hypothetical protein [Shinella sp. BYT-45]|uniref:hypothetical protein n=1 Tax=Shinella sp. BYT-45 TaxID=3377377 RepID=UPI00397EDDD7